MTFDAPLWLLLLLAAPVLWWLHRHLRAPREVLVASVEPLRGARLDATGRRPERTLDADLLLLLAAVVCLALSAAGARVGGGAPTVLVAIDTSASMAAEADGGGVLGDLAWTAARERIRQAVGSDVQIVAVDVAAPSSALPMALDDDAPFTTRHGVDDLPRSLVPLLALARRDAFPGLLLVTDRALATDSRVVVSGPGVGARVWPAILDVVLDDARSARVTLLRQGANVRALSVYRAPGGTTTVAVPAGDGPVVVTAPVPAPGGAAFYRLALLPRMDTEKAPVRVGPNVTLTVARRGGVRSVRITGPGAAAPRLRDLLTTLGVQVTAEPIVPVDVEIVVGGPLQSRDAAAPALHLAMPAGDDGDVAVRAAEPIVASAGVSCSGSLADAVPSPGITLVRTGVLVADDREHESTWRTDDGILALALQQRVVTTLDAESPASTWHSDPSFPVFVMTALEHIVGGPDRLVIRDGVPRSEILRDAAPPPPADVARISALVRSPEADPSSRSLAALLATAAAGMVALLLVRSRGRFSNA